MFDDTLLIIFPNLTLLQLKKLSYVSKRFTFLVFCFKRYRNHFDLAKLLISEKDWSLILDEHLNEFYFNVSKYPKFYLIPNVKNIFSIQNGLPHMFSVSVFAMLEKIVICVLGPI